MSLFCLWLGWDFSMHLRASKLLQGEAAGGKNTLFFNQQLKQSWFLIMTNYIKAHLVEDTCLFFKMRIQPALPTQSTGKGKSHSQSHSRVSTVCLQDTHPQTSNPLPQEISELSTAPISAALMEFLNIARAKPYFPFFYSLFSSLVIAERISGVFHRDAEGLSVPSSPKAAQEAQR